MKPFNYEQFRREFVRLKSMTTYERLLEDARRREQVTRYNVKPLTRDQCLDRDYETTPEARRLRPVEYAAFPYHDRRYDYTASNTAGASKTPAYCYTGKHRVFISDLPKNKRGVFALSCRVCQERARVAA